MAFLVDAASILDSATKPVDPTQTQAEVTALRYRLDQLLSGVPPGEDDLFRHIAEAKSKLDRLASEMRQTLYNDDMYNM